MNRRQFLLGTTAIVGLQLAPPALRAPATAASIFSGDALSPFNLAAAWSHQTPRWQMVGVDFWKDYLRQIESHERVTILKGRH